LAPEPINVGQLLAGLEDMLRRTLGSTIAVEQVISGGLWTLRADGQQLENAILNLAINARDAMADSPPDRARLTIEARNAVLDDSYCAANQEVRPGQYVMIAVSDSGCGMTAEQISRAIEPFYTTKPEGQGTGLGLSMVYGFAKQSGGHLKLYSEPGHGTTARLYIPRTIAPAAAPDAQRPPPAPGQGEMVLLVEDDPAVRAAAALALRGLGYRVEEAENADAAMALLQQGLRPDLIFTDVVMPGTLSARTMAAQAAALIPGLAVVFASGYTENSIVHNGQLDAGVHLISKPWRIEDLASRLRFALDLAQRTRLAEAPRVLLVEDDTVIRAITAEMLSELGYQIVEAADAEAALGLLDGVDLMITDIGLGATDGLTLAASVRARMPHLPVIVASGQAAQDVRAEGLLWLSKPYDSAALQAVLRQVRQIA
jgi:CheY-like chemotaxis protein